VCAAHRADLSGDAALGRCVRATARYVASHSNRLTCRVRSYPMGSARVAAPGARGHMSRHAMQTSDAAAQGCSWDAWGRWEVTEEADAWERDRGWPPDPMWTESNWPGEGQGFTLYQARDAAAPTACRPRLPAPSAVRQESVCAAANPTGGLRVPSKRRQRWSGGCCWAGACWRPPASSRPSELGQRMSGTRSSRSGVLDSLSEHHCSCRVRACCLVPQAVCCNAGQMPHCHQSVHVGLSTANRIHTAHA